MFWISKYSKRISNFYSQSIIFKICFFSIFFISLTLFTMCYFLNKSIINYFYLQNEKQLIGKIQLVNNFIEQNSKNLKCNLNVALYGHEEIFIQIKNINTNCIIYNNKSKLIDTKNINFTNKNWGKWDINHIIYSGFLTKKTIIINKKPFTYEILAGIKNNNYFYFMYFFKESLLIIGFTGLFFVIFFIIFSTLYGLRPVRKLAEFSENIYINNLDSRLDLSTMPMEIVSVAMSFNQMLDRLKLSIDKLSEFSSDLAHEIRTPINNIMMQTQVCLNKQRDNKYYKEVLLSNLEELNKLTKLISDMLFLAKNQKTSTIEHFQKINLRELFIDIIDYFEQYSTDKDITIKITGDAPALIDPYIFRRALNNLIYNAIQYAESHTTVEVEIFKRYNSSNILIKNKVNDTISNLTPQQLERFFDRFYRFDESRQSSGEGTGLGLAITKSIIEIHNGVITNYIINDTIIFSITLQHNID